MFQKIEGKKGSQPLYHYTRVDADMAADRIGGCSFTIHGWEDFLIQYCVSSTIKKEVGETPTQFIEFVHKHNMCVMLNEPRVTLSSLADRLMEVKMNRTSACAAYARILVTLHESGVIGLFDMLRLERDRMKADFDHYYRDAMDVVIQLCFFGSADVTDALLAALDRNYHGSGILLDNYHTLVKYDMVNRFYDFDSNFRGTVKKVTRINEYVVIECEKFKEDAAYYGKDGTSQYDSFDACLIAQMMPRYSDAAMALYRAERQS